MGGVHIKSIYADITTKLTVNEKKKKIKIFIAIQSMNIAKISELVPKGYLLLKMYITEAIMIFLSS